MTEADGELAIEVVKAMGMIEPEDVADAVVFNSLIADDGVAVLAEEKPTVFEPKTEDEPAHYAQGALLIPKKAKKYVIRFRIKLPGIDAESAYDIEQEVSH